jgi:hypothetical protein
LPYHACTLLLALSLLGRVLELFPNIPRYFMARYRTAVVKQSILTRIPDLVRKRIGDFFHITLLQQQVDPIIRDEPAHYTAPSP